TSNCCSEHAQSDKDEANDLYTKTVGRTAKTNDSPGMQYTEWGNNGTEIGGMYKITEEMKGMPPNWIPYFRVADCDATANKAKSSGGNLMVPPSDIPNVGRFSYIQDPQGATFAIIQLKGAP